MSQPLDRTCAHPVRGEVDTEAGEFWVENPFMIPALGENLSAYERNRLFLNVAGDGFLDASFHSAVDIDADSRSVAVGDFDGDGRPDLLVGSVGGGPLRLFLNRVASGNRLQFRLQGTASNREGIGARLIATIGERQVVRDVFPANGCLGGGPAIDSLGVGDATNIDRLWIRWPSGREQTIENIAVPSELVITEE